MVSAAAFCLAASNGLRGSLTLLESGRFFGCLAVIAYAGNGVFKAFGSIFERFIASESIRAQFTAFASIFDRFDAFKSIFCLFWVLACVGRIFSAFFFLHLSKSLETQFWGLVVSFFYNTNTVTIRATIIHRISRDFVENRTEYRLQWMVLVAYNTIA